MSLFEASTYALPHIARLDPYIPGQQLQGSGWVKLNTNENPYPPSPRAVEAMHDALGKDGSSLARYPDPTSRTLREAIAVHHGLVADQVIVGNGSDDVMTLLIRTFCGPQDIVGMTVPSYTLYPVLAGIQNTKFVEVLFERSVSLDPKKIIHSGAKLFFLTSPNAPTGVAFEKEAIVEVLESFPGILVLDEAYAPFAQEDSVDLLSCFPRLLIVRTFSKAYGLAGLRVGYGLGEASLLHLVDRVRECYNVDAIAQAGARAAIEDKAYTDARVQKIIQTRDAFAKTLESWGWFTYPSSANFIFTEPRTASGEAGSAIARALFDYLLDHKILVRYFDSTPLTCSFLRISIGSREAMEVVTQTLQSWKQNVQLK